MKTHIYYHGIDQMSIDYLKSDKFKDRMSLHQLEVEIKTEKSATVSSIRFRGDSFSSLFLITSSQKEEWLSRGKDKFLSKEVTTTLDDFSQLEELLQKTYSLPYDQERSAINILDDPSSTGVLNLENLDPQTPEQNSYTQSKIQSNQPQPQSSQPQTTQNQLSDPFNPINKPLTLDMVANSEKVKPADYLFDAGYQAKKVSRTKLDQFTLIEYSTSDSTSTAVEQTVAVEGFEVTVTKETEDLVKYKRRIKDLQLEISKLSKQYLGYQSPEAIGELADSYSKLQDEFESLDRKYQSLIENGDPNTKKAMGIIQEEMGRVKQELSEAKQDNENLFDVNNKLLEEKREVETNLRNLKTEYDQYKNTQAKWQNDMKEQDSFKLLESNVQISDANLKLRQKLTELTGQIENLKRENLEASSGLSGSKNQYHLSPQQRFSNITLIVSIGAEANLQTYHSILASPDHSSGKSILLDLNRNTYLLDAFSMRTIHNPNKYLKQQKSLQDSLSTAVALNGTGVSLETLTTVSHGLDRTSFHATDWDKTLQELNNNPSIMYIGNLEDGAVYDFLKYIQQNNIAITTLVVLPAKTNKTMYFNLIGLKLSQLHFAGQQGSNYDKLKISYTYMPYI